MGSTRIRRPPTPSAAERARSTAARGGTASLVGSGTAPAAPLVHLVRADGSALLLLDDDEPVLARAREEGAAMLEVTDRAPVDLREPVRGLLWLTGRLTALDGAAARSAAMQMAEVNPHPDLLRLGDGASLVRLDAGTAVLSDAEGTDALSPLQLAAARPDPFCRYETSWLAHLEAAHADVLARLRRHLPAALRDDREARVRPLGVDRCGLRLRVETPGHDHDVRLAWPADTTTPAELGAQLQHLAGCPARLS